MKNIFLVAIFALVPFLVSAQYLEGGIFLGTSNYAGDLVDAPLGVEFSESKFAGGLLLRYNINDWVGVRGSFTYGQISGTDENSDQDFRMNRNLSFRSDIYEFAVIPEFNILGFNPYDRFYSPYVFIGLGIFQFNPEAELDGQWYDLQPNGTEGQGLPGYGSPYNLTQISIPFGIGFKYAIDEYWTVGVEISNRYTFTDYLDDVSTVYPDLNELRDARGQLAVDLSNRSLGETPAAGDARGGENRDWYGWSGITVTYNFAEGFGRGSGCPTF